MRKGLVAGVVGIAIAASACTGSNAPTSPRQVALPRITSSDSPAERAGKLARYIEARWPRIRIETADATKDGTVVAFHDAAHFDQTIEDAQAYDDHVRRLTGDLTQASVELLKLSARFFPDLEYATVWQDRQLEAFWTKKQILKMGDPESYRDYQSFLRLVLSAEYPPSLPGLGGL